MAEMKYESIKAGDGCKLAFQTSLPLDLNDLEDERYETLILFIHGFSGSSAYFKKNFDSFSSIAWTVAVDLRGHGQSGRSTGGYHVARLAADLKELVDHLKGFTPTDLTEIRVIPVGCSIGAAVLWTYVELFTDEDFEGMVFVDQAPLQNRSSFDGWNQTKAHRGCFDEASMLAAQKTWIETPELAFKSLVQDCLGYRYAPHPDDRERLKQVRPDEEFFIGESRKCGTIWLARLLGDHTQYDHREACESINVPVLVMAGKRSGCFSLEGMKETLHRVKKGRSARGELSGEEDKWWVEFDSGHWLFWEEPERFFSEIESFLKEYVLPMPSEVHTL